MTYQDRDRIVVSLGFDNYNHYLKSDLWSAIKKMVYRAKGTDCSLCPAPASEIHHYLYNQETLRGQSMKHLWPICHLCHQSVEMGFNGSQTYKLPIHESQALFQKKRDRWLKQINGPLSVTKKKKKDKTARVNAQKMVERRIVAMLPSIRKKIANEVRFLGKDRTMLHSMISVNDLADEVIGVALYWMDRVEELEQRLELNERF